MTFHTHSGRPLPPPPVSYCPQSFCQLRINLPGCFREFQMHSYIFRQTNHSSAFCRAAFSLRVSFSHSGRNITSSGFERMNFACFFQDLLDPRIHVFGFLIAFLCGSMLPVFSSPLPPNPVCSFLLSPFRPSREDSPFFLVALESFQIKPPASQ